MGECAMCGFLLEGKAGWRQSKAHVSCPRQSTNPFSQAVTRALCERLPTVPQVNDIFQRNNAKT